MEVILKAIHSNLCDKRSTAFFKTYCIGTDKKEAVGYIAESISYLKCSYKFFDLYCFILTAKS